MKQNIVYVGLDVDDTQHHGLDRTIEVSSGSFKFNLELLVRQLNKKNCRLRYKS